MLRIAIDCRMIGSGGIGSFISELIPCFLEKNECLLIGSHEQCSDFVRLQNAEFCFCEISPFSAREFFSFPTEVLDRINKYDFYFTPYCNIPSGINIPIFSTIHDVVFLDVKELTGFAGRLARKFYYQRAINYSQALFTVSNFSKERILAHLHCKKEIEVVYNAAPAYLREPFEEEIKKRDEILFVGNIKRHKGLKILLDAFLQAKKNCDTFNSKLVIVGNADNFRTGDEETVLRLKKLSEEGGLVEFTGRISNNQLKNIYARAKFLVQPSLYEGFGMPPLEALTVNTPVLISDIPVFKEIYSSLPVTYFKSGDVNDLANKIIELNKKVESSSIIIDHSSLDELYSYKKSAQIICKTMEKFLKKS
ncbi:MAG: glycosyltransferase family 4 protein [Treponema sp.]|nr:glycosyltransferase family 4 protein [Treponema sp.]